VLDKIAIIGYSGHGYVVAECALDAGLNIRYYCDKKIAKENPFDLKYLGFEEDVDFLGWKEDFQFLLCIGDIKIRDKVSKTVLNHHKTLLNVIHPSSSISKHFEMGVGNFISRNVSVNPLVRMGNFCILNTACVIEHECKIGNSVHVAPGAVLAGSVQIGDYTFIGANAVIKQGVKIGANVTIGAGSVVLKDVAENETIVGNPGRVFRISNP
jgi:sugar O-acyltransferase (sialic acid O-acetyltransferase NeuD family)